MKLEEIGDNIISKVADRLQLPKALRLAASERTHAEERRRELAMHNEYSGWLNLRKRIFCYVHADPAGKSTIHKGWPDYTILRDGRALCIELKVPGNRHSPDQSNVFADLTGVGIDVYVCTSVGDAIHLTLEFFGIISAQLENDN
jgi:hypothetical protein